MARFITVSRDSLDFKKYLKGTFSNREVALPVEQLEGHQLRPNVTFQIFSREEIKRPGLFRALLSLYRVDLLILTVLPAGVVFLSIDPVASRSSLFALVLALFALHGATFAFNDYFDHMQGRDRLNEKTGSRLIQTGVLRAVDVLRIAWGYWALAALGGIILVYENPNLVIFALGGAFVGALGSMYQWIGLKSLGFSDIALLIGLGPLLTAGVSFASAHQVTGPVLILGLSYGLLALIYSQSKNIASSLIDYQAGVQTLAVRLGFDRAKTFICVELFAASIFAIFILQSSWIAVAIFAVATLSVGRQIFALKSPLSGQTAVISQRVLGLHFFLSFLCLLIFFIQRGGI